MSDKIVRSLGEKIVVSGGRDYSSPSVRIVPSMFEKSEENEKAIHISQGKNMGISISLETLEMIMKWAKKEV